MQSIFATSAQDHQESIFAPVAYKIGRPYCVSQGSSEHLQDGTGSYLSISDAELGELGNLQTNHGEGNLKVVERASSSRRWACIMASLGNPVVSARQPCSLMLRSW